MTPNIMKGQTDTFKYIGQDPPKTEANAAPNAPTNMDGDHSAKAMDGGANSATKATDLTEGIHENVKQTPGHGEKMTGQGASIFSKDGAVGGMFKSDGAIGGTAQAVGGPLDKQGMIGKHFESDGAVGSTFQELAKKNESH